MDHEMTYSGQLIDELNDARLMTFAEMALCSGVHENTIRDYARGNIKHFGREASFWNSILRRLCNNYSPNLPPIVYRIAANFFHDTPLCIAHVGNSRHFEGSPGEMFRDFAIVLRDVAGIADNHRTIWANGRIDEADDATIAEMFDKLNSVVAWALGVKARVQRDRSKAGAT